MKKCFNVSGTCYPDKHYMVNIDKRLYAIRQLVERGDYFVINRARQYGKTTTLKALEYYLRPDYVPVLLSFQGMSSAKFEDEYAFSAAFARAFIRVVQNKRKNITGLEEAAVKKLAAAVEKDSGSFDLVDLFEHLSGICASADSPVVLMIDEVDSASNNQVFLDFLAQLRAFYLDREETPTFQSVILAGVYDIKNLKMKIRSDEEHRYNSPWNIAADFDVDMSFSTEDIRGMLEEYEKENSLGMDAGQISRLIFDYTSGYPYLVSRICKLIDEKIVGLPQFPTLTSAWTKEGVVEAVKELLKESNTLFDDIRKKLSDYPKLRDMLYAILFQGKTFPYNPDNYAIDMGRMFGLLKDAGGTVMVADRIFETRLYNLFISEEITGIDMAW